MRVADGPAAARAVAAARAAAHTPTGKGLEAYISCTYGLGLARVLLIHSSRARHDHSAIHLSPYVPTRFTERPTRDVTHDPHTINHLITHLK